MDSIETFVETFLLESSKQIKKLDQARLGREKLGPVKGRPLDVELSIDRVAEEILRNMIKKWELRLHVFSENQDIPCKNLDYYAVCDPFDGTRIYRSGIPHMWYVALSIFNKEGVPQQAGIIEILSNRLYLTRKDGSYQRFLETGEELKLEPTKRTELNEDFSMTSYLMKPKRLLSFVRKYESFLESLNPRTLIYPNGGPGLFPYIADGMIDIYFVEQEPRLEVDSGYFLAEKAGCVITLIYPDGTTEPYKFIPKKQKERVTVLATSNKKLEEKILKILRKNKTIQ